MKNKTTSEIIYERLYLNKKLNETSSTDVHKRVADFVMGHESDDAEKMFNMMQQNKFRPNTPCLINAGSKSDKKHDKFLCACYVLGLEDTMDSIIQMWELCAKIYASGGGVGIPITNLREFKSPISNGGFASGPLNYSLVIDMISQMVMSGGKNRRAANAIVSKHNHPDILSIINAKDNIVDNYGKRKLSSLNSSISITNKFMDNIIYIMHNDATAPITTLFSPNGDKPVNTIPSLTIWNAIVQKAWECGDPGLFFVDRINKTAPFPKTHPVECFNVCGEIDLHPWSACVLGSINVSKYIGNFDELPTFFDWKLLKDDIFNYVTFLDNVIDKTEYPHSNFEKTAKAARPIGLGIMGFADMCISLNISYGSQLCIDFFDKLCEFVNKWAIHASILQCKILNKKPIEIPEQDKKHFENLLRYYIGNNSEIMDTYKKYGIRNSNWTALAPTGSIALSAECSYAWEPHMAIVWEKPLDDSNIVLKIVLPQFESYLEKAHKETGYSRELILETIANHKGSIQNIPYFDQTVKDLFKVAHDIDPIQKIKMQGAGQKWISMAISSTCNLPNSATKEDIEKIYIEAYRHGLKGITVFRDGCLNSQPVNFGKVGVGIGKQMENVRKEIEEMDDSKFNEFLKEHQQVMLESNSPSLNLSNKERPIKRTGETVEIKTPHGKLFVTCNFDSMGNAMEIFLRIGKQGALTNVLIDALGRVCSKALQNGIALNQIAETLSGLSGEKFWFAIDDAKNGESAESIVDAISQIMDYHWNNSPKFIKFTVEEAMEPLSIGIDMANSNDKTVIKEYFPDNGLVPPLENNLEKCPECGKKGLRRNTGCRSGSCVLCGYSACG